MQLHELFYLCIFNEAQAKKLTNNHPSNAIEAVSSSFVRPIPEFIGIVRHLNELSLGFDAVFFNYFRFRYKGWY